MCTGQKSVTTCVPLVAFCYVERVSKTVEFRFAQVHDRYRSRSSVDGVGRQHPDGGGQTGTDRVLVQHHRAHQTQAGLDRVRVRSARGTRQIRRPQVQPVEAADRGAHREEVDQKRHQLRHILSEAL